MTTCLQTSFRARSPYYYSRYRILHLTSHKNCPERQSFYSALLYARSVAVPPYDAHAVEGKWQRVWEEKKVYRAIASPAKPKFFANVPYPYVNGDQHLGFAVP